MPIYSWPNTVAGNTSGGSVLSGVLSSGIVTSGFLGNASVVSGSIASGSISTPHIASGFSLVSSGKIEGFFGKRDIASGTVGVFDFGSGAVIAGTVGSGAVRGGYSAQSQIASGSIGTNDIGSGGIQAGNLGFQSVQSGQISSGIVGSVHIASGAVTSGRLGVTGTPNGTQFLRDDFTWAAVTSIPGSGSVTSGAIASGAVISGTIGSGAVQGFFGTIRNIASGTVGVFDFGSGAVIAGTVGSGAVVSGNVASGQIGHFHLSSGAVLSGNVGSGVMVDTARSLVTDQIASGTMPMVAGETISGAQAVTARSGGVVWIAKAGTSGFAPALGIVRDPVLSGQTAIVYTHGYVPIFSGSTYLGTTIGDPLFLGLSGTLDPTPPSVGGSSSGILIQTMGTAASKNGIVLSPIQVSGDLNTLRIASGGLQSGAFGSGQIGQFAISSGAVTSGRLGVTGTPTGTNFLRDDFTWAAAGSSTAGGNASVGAIRTVSGSYVVASGDYTVLSNMSGASGSITVPAAPFAFSGTINQGAIFNIKKIDASPNTVTVVGASGDLIDGASSVGLSTQNQSIQIQTDGTSYWIL